MDSGDEKSHAHPWGMSWPRLKYEILTKDELFTIRRKVADKTPYLKKLKNEEIALEYEKYLCSISFKESSSINYYDPLSGYTDSPLPKDPAYLNLVNMDLNSDQEILSFINKNGLLGLLFHEYEYLSYGFPKPNIINPSCASEKLEEPDSEKEEKDYLLDKIIFKFEDEKSIELENSMNDQLWFKYDDDGFSLIPMTIKMIYKTFFPLHVDYDDPINIPYNPSGLKIWESRANYEKIISNGSWCIFYAEPLELFKEAARSFADTYSRLTDYKNITSSKTKISQDTYSLFGDFNKHLQRIHPQPRFISKTDFIGHGWKVPSLLSAYYLMLYLDLTNKRSARYCSFRNCNRPFIAERDDNIYCSFRCKDAAKKDRKRHPELYNQ